MRPQYTGTYFILQIQWGPFEKIENSNRKTFVDSQVPFEELFPNINQS